MKSKSTSDQPTVKSAPAKGAAAAPAKKAVTKAAPLAPGVNPWDDYFANTKFKTPAEAEEFLLRTVADLVKSKNYETAENALKGFLKPETHGKDAQAWMYIWLAECLKARQGPDSDMKQALSFGAFLAKRSKNPTDLIRIADLLVLRGLYDPVGDPGYQTNIGELVDLAAEKVPANAIPPMMSKNLATHDKDPKRMADAAERLLSLGWPGIDDKIRRDTKEDVKALAKALNDEGRTSEADALMAQLADSEARDVFIKLTWKGEADIDMAVAEPLGATAKYANPRTVFGGAIIKNGYGNHPEEVYVCPRAFEGDYAIAVEKIVDWDEKKPVLEADLEIILHEGTAEETRQSHKIDLARPQPIVVHLDKGRRKTVLPLIATPPQTQTRPARERPKAPAAKPAAPPAGRGAPIK